MNIRPREQQGHMYLRAGCIRRTTSTSVWCKKIVHQKCQSGFSQVGLQNKESIIQIGLYTCMCVLSCFSRVQLFVPLWTVDRQTPLSMGFSRQEYWSRLPCPPPGNLPNPGTEWAKVQKRAEGQEKYHSPALIWTWQEKSVKRNCFWSRASKEAGIDKSIDIC